jgi:hypothetical protein
MTDAPDLEAFLTHIAQRFEAYAEETRLQPKIAEAWLAKATGTHAAIREMRRLWRIEKHARAVDEIFDEKQDVIRLRCRVADGNVDHREHFLKLRKALEPDPVIQKAKGELG